MQDLIYNSWEKIRPSLLVFFHLLLTGLNWLKDLGVKIFNFCQLGYFRLKSLLVDLSSSGLEAYEVQRPLAIAFSREHPLVSTLMGMVAASLVIFWFWMLWHAAKKEPERKKLWTWLVFLFGILGAAIYYFFRKGALERLERQHLRVQMSFLKNNSKFHSKN